MVGTHYFQWLENIKPIFPILGTEICFTADERRLPYQVIQKTMTIEFNRRTFLVLLGASSAAVAIGRPSARISLQNRAPASGTPRCFMSGQDLSLPAGPKTAAIIYLCE
jgi:hypothetical protein